VNDSDIILLSYIMHHAASVMVAEQLFLCFVTLHKKASVLITKIFSSVYQVCKYITEVQFVRRSAKKIFVN